MRDMLGSIYTHYFETYLKYNRSNEARLFAYSFLNMGAFLTENSELMEM
ncbi:hypothetical protein ACF3NR_09450 [Vaginella massiliensis]